MNICDSKNCLRHKGPSVKCLKCKKMTYCSEKCREYDWTYYHRLACYPEQRGKSADDDQSSLQSMRRRPEEFEVINKGGQSDLGKGSYGQVKLVKDKTNGKEYAMKIISKKMIFEYCSAEVIKREIKIQRKLIHPNVTKLIHYFEDKNNVYLILEYCENGSVFSYQRKKRKFTESEAFKFFYQTCLGIDYLHKNKVIHRDLKVYIFSSTISKQPENLLLDKDLNVKLCDFGWSAEKFANDQRNTFCGTCEYMAPEMLRHQPHDFSLDLWCLGILLYEFLHGYTPFRGKSEHEICENILRMKPYQFSNTISDEAIDLIQGLLKYNISERMTMKQLLDHIWMKKHSYQSQIKIVQPIFIEEKKEQLIRKNYRDVSPIPNKQKEMVKYKSEEQKLKHRVSLVSERNEQLSKKKQEKEQQPKQEEGIIDKVLYTFGCLKKRDMK